MQHISSEKGFRKGQNIDGECDDVQLNMGDPFKNIKTLETEEYHTALKRSGLENRLVN